MLCGSNDPLSFPRFDVIAAPSSPRGNVVSELDWKREIVIEGVTMHPHSRAREAAHDVLNSQVFTQEALDGLGRFASPGSRIRCSYHSGSVGPGVTALEHLRAHRQD